jgi:hypothetical protein
MTSWNYSTVEKTDPNPPHLTNLENGSGEYSDNGRTGGLLIWPDGFFAAGCLGAAVIVGIILILIPVIMIFGD